MDTQNTVDAEFSAMQTLYSALEPLDDDARSRVMSYIVDRLDINLTVGPKSSVETTAFTAVESGDLQQEENSAPKFSALAELYDATQPKSNADKALVAGYWLQVCQEAESFDAFSANKELKHLGQGVNNITNAIDGLKTQKPALAIQLKKTGKSQQARKIYKITVAGIKYVEAMMNG